MQKAVRHYADLRTARGQKAAQEAWETPVVEARDRGVSASAKRQTRHDRKRRPSRTRPNGGMADPEGSVILHEDTSMSDGTAGLLRDAERRESSRPIMRRTIRPSSSSHSCGPVQIRPIASLEPCRVSRGLAHEIVAV